MPLRRRREPGLRLSRSGETRVFDPCDACSFLFRFLRAIFCVTSMCLQSDLCTLLASFALLRQPAAVHSSLRRSRHHRVQTFPAWSVMHGHHEGITKGSFPITTRAQNAWGIDSGL